MHHVGRTALVIVLLAAGCVLVGCPGMPGMPGAGGGSQQNVPPGVMPPPGLESGGVRTLMGTTVTPPENSYLLVSYEATGVEGPGPGVWWSCRRLTVLDGAVLMEGLNFDGRAEDKPKDVNRIIGYQQLAALEWKYEPRPTPPPEQPAEESGKAAPK